MSEGTSGFGVCRHGGNRRVLAARARRPVEEIIDFSVNINPLGSPRSARGALRDSVTEMGHYPDPDCEQLRGAVSAHLGVPADHVLPGNGAEELIWWLPRLLGARRLVVTAPSYVDYRRSAVVWGLEVLEVALDSRTDFALDPRALAETLRDGDLVWIGQPNNPTGRLVDQHALAAAAAACPGTWWAVDEAFIDFVGDGGSVVALGLDNVVVVRSMTKFYA
jgi:threonine-phosphate decarboxylase